MREKLGATEFLGYETESAEGIVTAVGTLEDFDKPIVVRLDDNNAALGRQILADANIDGVTVVPTMDGAADVVTEIAEKLGA